VIGLPYVERRALLEGLALGAGPCSSPRHSPTAPLSSRRPVRMASRVSSPNDSRSTTALGNAAGSKSKTGTTGATAQRSSRCGRASSGDSFASAEGDSDRDSGTSVYVSSVRLLLAFGGPYGRLCITSGIARSTAALAASSVSTRRARGATSGADAPSAREGRLTLAASRPGCAHRRPCVPVRRESQLGIGVPRRCGRQMLLSQRLDGLRRGLV
jgi:hypothetical protein